MLLLSLGYKIQCNFHPDCLLTLLNHRFGRSQLPCCEQPYAETHMMRNCGLWPTANEKPIPPTNSDVSEIGSSYSSWLHLQMTVVPGDILSATLRETQSQSYTAQLGFLVIRNCVRELIFDVLSC